MNKLPKETYLPMFWYEITVEVDQASALEWQFTMGLIRFFFLYGYIGWLIFSSLILLTMVIRAVNRFALQRAEKAYRNSHGYSLGEDERMLIESSHIDIDDNNRLRRLSEINGVVSGPGRDMVIGGRVDHIDLNNTVEREELPEGSTINDEAPLI